MAVAERKGEAGGTIESVGHVNNASIKSHGIGNKANGGVAGRTSIKEEVLFVLAGTAGMILSFGDFELTTVLLVVNGTTAVKSHKIIVAIINKAPKDDQAPVSSVVAHGSAHRTEREIGGIIKVDVLVKLNVGEVPALIFFAAPGNAQEN